MRILWNSFCLSVFDHFVGLALKGLRLKNARRNRFLRRPTVIWYINLKVDMNKCFIK